MTGRLLLAVVLVLSVGCGAQPRPEEAPEPATGGGGPAPSAAGPGSGSQADSAAGTSPGAGGTTASTTGRRSYTFPVRGRASYSRAHHDYPATDIFAACRTPVVAPVRGVLLEVRRRDRYRPGPDNPALRGGRFWSLRGDDRVRYYGSHLGSLAPGIRSGGRVRAGTPLGRVGQSGNARGSGCHLHFGLSPVCAGTGDWSVRRGTVPPFRFLRAWQRDRDLSPARAVRRWRAGHHCPAPPR